LIEEVMIPAGLIELEEGIGYARISVPKEIRESGLVVRAYDHDYWNKTVIVELANAFG